MVYVINHLIGSEGVFSAVYLLLTRYGIEIWYHESCCKVTKVKQVQKTAESVLKAHGSKTSKSVFFPEKC